VHRATGVGHECLDGTVPRRTSVTGRKDFDAWLDGSGGMLKPPRHRRRCENGSCPGASIGLARATTIGCAVKTAETNLRQAIVEARRIVQCRMRAASPQQPIELAAATLPRSPPPSCIMPGGEPRRSTESSTRRARPASIAALPQYWGAADPDRGRVKGLSRTNEFQAGRPGRKAWLLAAVRKLLKNHHDTVKSRRASSRRQYT